MFFLSLCIPMALAIPQQFEHQGRLLSDDGIGLSGQHELVFRLFSDETTGFIVWEETLSLPFENGFYSATLGLDEENNPLDSSVFEQSPLWMELKVDGTILTPRHALKSVPFSTLSESAHSIDGGPVNATEISVNDTLVIDSSGQWLGPLPSAQWNDISNIPADIADGDQDTLSGLSCGNAQVASWTGTTWGCSDDNSLSEAQVEQFIVNDAIDLASGSSMNGSVLVTTNTDSDVLSNMNCADGEVAAWNASTGMWTCQNAGLNVSGCTSGDMLFYDNATGNWSCAPGFDQDSDGVYAWNDCDDNDPNSLSSALDLDCDGVLPPDDCDNADPFSTTTAIDGDCDGTVTAMDCDDSNPNSNIVAIDADCDGALTADDCDDNDPYRAPGMPETCNDGIDQDCDGYDDMSCVQLYAFSSHTFDPCGESGMTGPNLSQCQNSYATTWSSSNMYFNVVNGVQQWVVPKSGVYLITAYGAAGGPNHCSDAGGPGAMMEGEFYLNSGDTLNIISGQMGTLSNSGNCANGGSGGGGGSFVWINGEFTPLIVAGGGAGSNLTNNGYPNYIGGDGLSSESGGDARNGYSGGTGGNDGQSGGGKGWLSVMNSPAGVDGNGTYNGYGGFGGGGGGGQGCGNMHIGGGGGGYSGGATSNQCYYAGGGGGSYNTGSNTNQADGANTGQGEIQVTFLY